MKVAEAVDILESRVKILESIKDKAGEASALYSALNRLEKKALKAELPLDLSVPYSKLSYFIIRPEDGDREVMEKLTTAVLIADDLGWDEEYVTHVQDLLDRYMRAFAKEATGDVLTKTTVSPLVTAECECGWTWYNTWRSVSMATKKHAHECNTANPGLGDNLINDLSRVKKELFEEDNTHAASGGVIFSTERRFTMSATEGERYSYGVS